MNRISISDFILFNNTKEEALNFFYHNNIEIADFYLDFDDEKQMERVNYILANKNFEEVSFHSPCKTFNLDCDGETWANTINHFRKSVDYCKKHKGSSMVFHTNEVLTSESNKRIIENHIDEVIEIAKSKGVHLTLENVGTGKDMLYSESEFIDLVKRKNIKVLIDTGHLFLNNWSFENVITELKDYIEVYHLHNNDGKNDLHISFFNGYFEVNEPLNLIKNLTPQALLMLEYSPLVSKEELLKDLSKLNSLV